MYRAALTTSEHPFFTQFITFCILANTAVLASDHHGIESTMSRVFELLNFIFFAIFFLEMAIKLVAMGFKLYFKDRFNTFDCIIVLVSTVDVILTASPVEFGGGGAISALRAFRLLRVFKLAKTWRSF